MKPGADIALQREVHTSTKCEELKKCLYSMLYIFGCTVKRKSVYGSISLVALGRGILEAVGQLSGKVKTESNNQCVNLRPV